MCGILGVVEGERPVLRGAFERMLETLAPRGPDGHGIHYLREDRVALGHTRLAIIDLSPDGAQPMANEDGSVWLTFNGEIYNYRALRDALERAGHRFASRSDSEVIVHAYEQWGDDCVRHLSGIFAFGIWDDARGRLLLARDRLGVKPLYYASGERRLSFASLPRALAEAPEFERRLDPSALRDYLAYGYVPFDRAIFRGMRKLPAAHRLVWEGGSVRVDRYWELPVRQEPCEAGEAAFAVSEQIEASVVDQLVSDVPIGLFLSGGIDSTGVGAIAAERFRERLQAFTIGFEDADCDERRYARVAARATGTLHHEEVLDEDGARDLLRQVIEAYDEPFYPGSAFPTYRVSELARRHQTKVVLAGDGGDEVFAGYLYYDDYRSVRATPRVRRMAVSARRALRRGPWRGTDPVSEFFALPNVGVLDWSRQRGILGRRVAREVSADVLWPLRRFYRPDLPPVTAARYMDLHLMLVDHILCKVDRASMANGVEVRVPLLDHALVELGFRIPEALVYRDGERKALLRRALAERIPAELNTPRKKGFSIPLDRWMDRRLGELGRELLFDGSLVGRGLLDGDGVRAFYDGDLRRHRWLLLAAELWARRWLEGQDLAGPLEAARA